MPLPEHLDSIGTYQTYFQSAAHDLSSGPLASIVATQGQLSEDGHGTLVPFLELSSAREHNVQMSPQAGYAVGGSGTVSESTPLMFHCHLAFARVPTMATRRWNRCDQNYYLSSRGQLLFDKMLTYLVSISTCFQNI